MDNLLLRDGLLGRFMSEDWWGQRFFLKATSTRVSRKRGERRVTRSLSERRMGRDLTKRKMIN